MINKNKIVFFANTLWFLEKFKYELIKNISDTHNVICIYLREGPTLNKEKIKELELKRNVKFYSILDFFFSLLSSKLVFINKSNKKNNYIKIIIFNIGPIIISLLLPLHYKKNTVYVLEGLGRIFSSKLIFNLFIKVLVTKIYKFLFKRCNLVYVLNSYDYLFLVESNICKIDKIILLPGTGINCKNIDASKKIKREKTKYIDYMGRLITEKGFYKFILCKLNFMKYYPELDQKYIFRIISPREDINNLSKDEIDFLNKLNIQLKPYLVEPFHYYNESKALIVPSSYGEGLSRVVLEASYFGIPILATKIRGIEEILQNDYKYYIKSHNPFCISQQLANLLRDENYFDKIKEKQKIYIKNNFSINNSIEIFTSNLFKN